MKRILAIILASLMLLTLVSCDKDDVVAEGNDNTPVKGNQTVEEQKTEEPKEEKKNYPDNILMDDGSYINRSSCVLGNEAVLRADILTVTFRDTLEGMPEDAWDVSDEKNGSVMAWVTDGVNLYIAGEGGVTAKDCRRMFLYYRNVVSFDFGGCFYADVTDNFYETFTYCEKLETLDLSGMNTSGVQDMSSMFYGCYKLKNVDLTGWDTSNVLSMNSLFDNCWNLESADLSHFDTSKVADFREMFSYCKKLNSVDLSAWDTSSAKSMENMFDGCQSLKTVGELKIPEGCITDGMFSGSPLA